MVVAGHQQAENPRGAWEEWRGHWSVVLAATFGFSLQSVSTYSMGLFMEPLEREFGWSRADASAGLTVPALLMLVMAPFIGAMVDRWGSRRLAVPGCIATAFAIAAFGLADGTLSQWLGLWAIFAVMSLAVKPTIWTAAVSGMFSASRGTALAITYSGVAIAQIVVPPLSYWLITSYGWRTAFVALGLGWGAIVLVPVLLFFFDAHDVRRSQAKVQAVPIIALPGLTLREAARSIVLWRIGAASFLTMLCGIAAIVHQVPILTEAGVERGRAAALAGLVGVAGIAGKLMTGWLMDRGDSSRVSAATLACAAVGFLMLMRPGGSIVVVVLAMLIIGYSVGAKLQISAYLTSRYAGMRHFGKIFGIVSSLIAIGSGFGPMLAGALHDHFGSYGPLLLVGAVGSVASGLLVLGLGPYPSWEKQ